ncbi:hypothetical protein GOODEAATRI_013807 [Goodea atripinnis]|uniref:Myosin motor domain-containing protein n=1 Tax=Goodea atripinnis TaxID=208336 RepID=A0ABV0NMG2_9TELE
MRPASSKDNLETSDVGKSEHFTFASSLLQAIYNKLFIWIVGKINSVISQKLANGPKSSFLFEQLCINFANEKLQQFFVAHIFKLEQEEYLKEGVMWNNIQFSDNQKILDLLAGKPCNVLALIDEETNFPKGSDSTLLNKMNSTHRKDKAYINSKSEHDRHFGIRHFAGDVSYNTNGFLEKNRDGVSYDIIKTIEMSTNRLLHDIFEKDLSTNGVKPSKIAKFIMTPTNSMRV